MIIKRMLSRNYLSLMLFLAITLIHSCASTPITDEDKTFQKIVEVAMSKDQIWFKTRSWMVERFRSSEAVIEYEDKEAGRISGNTIISCPIGLAGIPVDVRMTIIIDIKDNKVRFTGRNFKAISLSDGKYFTPSRSQYKRIKERLRNLLSDYIQYLEETDTNDDW